MIRRPPISTRTDTLFPYPTLFLSVYRWYDRYLERGPEALEDRPSAPRRVWNRICDDIQQQIIDMALDTTDLSPRELAVRVRREALLRVGSHGLPYVESPLPDRQSGLHSDQGRRWNPRQAECRVGKGCVRPWRTRG